MLLLKLLLPLCLIGVVVSLFDCNCALAVVCLTTKNTMCLGVPTGRDNCLASISPTACITSNPQIVTVADVTLCPNYSNSRETCIEAAVATGITLVVAGGGVVTIFCILVPSACGFVPPSPPPPPPTLPPPTLTPLPPAPRPQISQC